MEKKREFGKIKRIVVKVGTTVLLSPRVEQIDPERLHTVTSQIAALGKQKIEVILVSSGAIPCGMQALGLKARPTSLPEAQAVAAIGQAKLMKLYDDDLRQKGILTSQVLLTQDDLRDRKRCWNARNTLLSLLRLGALPIVNENDTVATEEICLGDNDRLSSLVAWMIGADLLVILSDVDGLYADFRTKEGKLLDSVERIDAAIERLASDRAKQTSRGGMKTKIQAAKIATAAGIPVVITNGRKEGTLLKVVSGESVGTLFLPRTGRLGSRKGWIAFSSRPKGKVRVDQGAKEALLERGKSLLPSGILGTDEVFSAGEIISIVDEKSIEFARGLINYSSGEVEKIRGLKSDRIAEVLGYKRYDEVIHRDNMVIL